MAKKLEVLSLLDIVPPSISGDKNVKAIIKATDPQIQEVSQNIREAFIISRINELPENVIDLLAWQWHVDSYEPKLPIETKRKLVLDSIRLHRKKGTKSAIKSALEKFDFVPTIKEWFEIGTKPHTFEIYGHYKGDDLNVDFLGADTEELLSRVIENTKPARSKLLRLIIAPVMPEHPCMWDVCEWGHFRNKINYGGVIKIPIFEDNPLSGIEIFRAINTVDDVQYWNFSTWGGTPYRLLQVGQEIRRDIYAERDRKGATWHIPYSWGDFTWNDSERYSLDFGTISERNTEVDFNIKEQVIGTVCLIGIYASLQPYWDFYTWRQHGTWNDDLGVPRVSSRSRRDVKASLHWSDSEAPLRRWSKHKTWKNGTWKKGTELSGTWEVGRWTEIESKE